MSPKVLLFGAGGALGAAIATHLSGEGFAVYTAGTTHWDGAIAHLALGYGDRCDTASFSSLPGGKHCGASASPVIGSQEQGVQ